MDEEEFDALTWDMAHEMDMDSRREYEEARYREEYTAWVQATVEDDATADVSEEAYADALVGEWEAKYDY